MVKRGELELGATLIPETPRITTMGPQARPAASPRGSGLRLGEPRHKKPGGTAASSVGSLPPPRLVATGLREGQCGHFPVASSALQTHFRPQHRGGKQRCASQAADTRGSPMVAWIPGLEIFN